MNAHMGSLVISTRSKFIFGLAAVLALLIMSFQVAWAQDSTGTPEPPAEESTGSDSDIPLVHLVQEGETLFTVAEQYGTTIETLQILNSINDPSLLFVGQQLVIPGGGGEAAAALHTIRVGDTLLGVAADYNTTLDDLVSSNRLLNPYRLAAGRSLTVISRTGSAEPEEVSGDPYTVQSGDTLLSIAVEYGLSPAAIKAENQLSYPAYLHPGQRLRLPGEGRFQFLPTPWKRIEMYPVSLYQGESAGVYVESALPGMPFGTFAGQTLQFSPFENGFLALVGIDAFTDSGLHELRLDGAGDRPWYLFSQQVNVQNTGYGIQYIDVPAELAALLVPEIRAEEDAFLAGIYSQFTNTAYWDGPFTLPVTGTVISASYGASRSYNQGPVEIFHTGIDFAGSIGTPIYAPASGKVIFSDTLEIRGNTLILDHGLGVMTGYYHLSAVHVDVNQDVDAGQHIADGGSTGLSTGPHLHWDLRVMDAAVDGLQWIEEDIIQRIPR